MKNPFRSVVSVIVALFGVQFALTGAGMLVVQLRAARWPVTTGTLLSAEVGTRTTTNSKGGASTMYYKKVSYTYTLEGQVYQGVTHRPPVDESNDQSSLRSTNQAQVDTLWQQQKTQGHINVYYNPGNPSQGALLGLKQWYRDDVDLTVEHALLRVRVTGYLSTAFRKYVPGRSLRTEWSCPLGRRNPQGLPCCLEGIASSLRSSQ